jgi:hypothetical protein
MATRKSRKKRAANAEPTARPRPISEELPAGAFVEEGLSVDPEDLGAQFLVGATEQRNFESLRPADLAELSITSGATSDEPLVGPNMDVEQTPWEQAVELTVQSGSREPPTLEAAAMDEAGDDDDRDVGSREVNLLQASIKEGSLFDEESDDAVDTEAPRTTTDDSVPKGVRDRSV